MGLKEYNKKRDFKKTPEPSGEIISDGSTQRFVVQRHDATKLHYDLRLEINGTLKSWAIPKGPSMNAADKRLAIRTEDHPIKYLHFHGTIPKGNYGAGDMMIWDSGTFEVDRSELKMSAYAQLQKGNLKVIFHGKYIKGNFALVRTGNRNEKESWLLIKKKDSYATTLYYDAESIMEPSESQTKKYPGKITLGKIVPPMLASSAEKIFNDPNWIYELKWDGYRILAHISKKGVLLQSRHGINYNEKFQEVVKELEELEHEAILDGEIVVLDADGVSQFGELQNYPESEGTLSYKVFDMLYLNGHSMLDLPLLDRKSLIPELIEGLTLTNYCDHIESMGAAFYDKTVAVGMEGVMAKHSKSTYTLGARTEQWLKVKAVQDTDALICGYTDSDSGGAAFGSLILGTREAGKIKYIGNCGSSFSESYRKELLEYFKSYRNDSNPFGRKVNLNGRVPNWMVPTLQCEVKFTEHTKNGLLRNPVFKRLLHKPNSVKQQHATSFSAKSLNSKEILTVDGLPVPISNLDKIYWPESGMTKFELIDYYIQIADILIPHLKNRPQSLHRHTNGITEDGFYQKDNEALPEWMESGRIYSKSSDRDINYMLCQNTAALIYMANLGCIEINPWHSRIGQLDSPDYGIIDLDPPEGMPFGNVVKIASEFKKIFDAAEIPAYCKTSGSKGLHLYIPMGAAYSYGEVRNFIKLLCYFIEQRLPKIATMERRIKDRKGKIYLDYLQNRRGHTIASVYSVRPLAGAPVSTPILWHELDSKLTARKFTMNNMLNRLENMGDLFANLSTDMLKMELALARLETIDS